MQYTRRIKHCVSSIGKSSESEEQSGQAFIVSIVTIAIPTITWIGPAYLLEMSSL